MASKKKILNTDVLTETLKELNVADIQTEIKAIEKQLNSIINSYKNDNEEKYREQYEEGVPFFEVYSDRDVVDLPSWIKNNLDSVRVIGNSRQTLMLPDGRKYQINNTLNHLSGSEWTYFTNSVLNTAYRTNGKDSMAHNIRKVHPTPKPPQLMKDIIEFFTKENEIVLDYFMGVGGSLLGAALCGRRAIGIDLSEQYVNAYKSAAKELGMVEFPTIVGDSLKILQNKNEMKKVLKEEQVGLVLIDPPYGNMMSRQKTGADIQVYGNVATPFTDKEQDLGNLELENFYVKLKESVEYAMEYLKIRGYVVIFIKDLQPCKKQINMLHADIVNALNEIPNLNYKGMRIWADQTSKLFPYGYPFSFVANQIHQYILVFRKEKA